LLRRHLALRVGVLAAERDAAGLGKEELVGRHTGPIRNLGDLLEVEGALAGKGATDGRLVDIEKRRDFFLRAPCEERSDDLGDLRVGSSPMRTSRGHGRPPVHRVARLA